MSGNDEVGPENAHFLQGLSLQLILTKVIPLLTFSRISRSLHPSNIIKFNFKSKVQSASPTKYQRFFLRVAHLPFFYYYIHMKDKLIPVTLLTGYLGAGKTTLMNYILNNQTGYKVAVIVNDIGEVNIDAALIEKGAGIVEEDKDSIVPLQNGCICCSLKTDLIEQIVSLTKQNKFDYILIEASGICEPQPIAETIHLLSGYQDDYEDEEDGQLPEIPAVARLDTIVAVVDAARMVQEFAGGNSLLNKGLEEHDIEALLVQQIEFCNIVLINKVDLVTAEQLEQVRQVVRVLQPQAKIIETTRAEVDLSLILGTNSFDFEEVFTSAGWLKTLNQFEEEQKHHHEHHHEHGEECECDCGHHHHDEECGCGHHHHDEECGCGHHHHHHDGKCSCGHDHHHSHTEEFGISTFVYFRRKPFDRMKLDEFAQNWPKTVIRTKGIMWLSDDNASAFVLEQAGHQISAGYSGDWMATGTKAQIKATMEADPEFKRNWDERVGDRMIKLVFIGKDMNKDKIIADLDACLVEPTL